MDELVAARFMAGWCCGRGVGGAPKDEERAMMLYRHAAAQEYPTAQFQIGLCHNAGRGVPRDDQEAVRWFEKAAKQGHIGAQLMLGKCYQLGEGVKMN